MVTHFGSGPEPTLRTLGAPNGPPRPLLGGAPQRATKRHVLATSHSAHGARSATARRPRATLAPRRGLQRGQSRRYIASPSRTDHRRGLSPAFGTMSIERSGTRSGGRRGSLGIFCAHAVAFFSTCVVRPTLLEPSADLWPLAIPLFRARTLSPATLMAACWRLTTCWHAPAHRRRRFTVAADRLHHGVAKLCIK